MNANGETFEDNPPRGHYVACPLPSCKYKLRLMDAREAVAVGADLVRMADGLKSVQELVHERIRAEHEREEQLVQAHLKTHTMMDFYQARTEIMNKAYDEVSGLMRLADLVFASTATQETTQEGG